MFGLNKKQTLTTIKELEQSVIKAHADRLEVVEGLQAEVERLTTQKRDAVGSLQDLKDKRKRDEEELKHQLAMREDRIKLEADKVTLKQERDYETKVAKLHQDYRDKTEVQLKAQNDTLKKMYSEVLARLPNLNAKLGLKGDV